MQSWGDIWEEYVEDQSVSRSITFADYFLDWLKVNYNPPFKKFKACKGCKDPASCLVLGTCSSKDKSVTIPV